MNSIHVSPRGLAIILAALRTAQEHHAAFVQMPHFTEEDIEPPSLEEMDELCEAINCGD